MNSFLLLVGVALFFCGAAMYFSHVRQHEDRWLAWATASVLLPFLVPGYYRRHWEDLQVAGLLQAAGLVMTISGAFALAFLPDPAATTTSRSVFSTRSAESLSGFVESERALKMIAQQAPGTRAVGRINGRRFVPDRMEFIDGILRLSEGPQFNPVGEIAIELGEPVENAKGIRRIVAPYSSGAPRVFLGWRAEDGSPVTEIISGGYRMEVQLQPTSRGKMAGYLQLTLPDAQESYMSGDLDVVTTHLRYRDGEVDRSYDHADTIAFVGEEYLYSQYNAVDVEMIEWNDMVVDPLDGRASAVARVVLKDGRIGLHAIRAARSEFGWGVLGTETSTATEAAGYKRVYGLMPADEPVKPRPTAVPARRPGSARPVAVEKVLAFDELASLSGQGAVVEFRDGRREQGVLRGIDRNRLIVEAIKGGGTVQFRVSDAELARLKMNDGSIVMTGSGSLAATESKVDASSRVGGGQHTPLMVGGQDVSDLLNRNVRVVSRDGKTIVGVFRGVNQDRLVIGTLVGGGNVDYTVPVTQLESIDAAPARR